MAGVAAAAEDKAGLDVEVLIARGVGDDDVDGVL